jgi:acyl carrier protein
MIEAGPSPIAQVKDWLIQRRPEMADIDPDFDLIENRVIDSLSFMDFLFYIEALAQRDIEVTPDTVDSLRTLRAIESRIFRGHQ